MNLNKRITVADAARVLGKDPQFVRIGLQNGKLPIGVAFKTDEDNSKYDYYISPKQLQDFTGCDLDEFFKG